MIDILPTRIFRINVCMNAYDTYELPNMKIAYQKSREISKPPIAERLYFIE